ncbi:MAG: winged helix-turn-helix transcriptional regulator [Pseudomonadota bacterium]
MKWQDVGGLGCSVARTLGVIGDRWTMLVVRNAFLGIRRFDDFQQSLGVTRHILADRLNRLVDAGVLKKVAYQDKPPRYEYRLTEQGRDLYPVLLSLTAWGDKWLDEGKGAPVEYHHKSCGRKTVPVLACSECGETLDPREVMPMPGPGLRPAAGK